MLSVQILPDGDCSGKQKIQVLLQPSKHLQEYLKSEEAIMQVQEKLMKNRKRKMTFNNETSENDDLPLSKRPDIPPNTDRFDRVFSFD